MQAQYYAGHGVIVGATDSALEAIRYYLKIDDQGDLRAALQTIKNCIQYRISNGGINAKDSAHGLQKLKEVRDVLEKENDNGKYRHDIYSIDELIESLEVTTKGA